MDKGLEEHPNGGSAPCLCLRAPRTKLSRFLSSHYVFAVGEKQA
jgi:hypothetical protein